MAKAVRAVTMIPPTINPLTRQAIVATVKRRVAGYARVSTDSDEQFTSYEAQIDYYTHFRHDRLDRAALHSVHHLGEAGPLEVGSAPSVIHEKLIGHQAMLTGVAFEDALLIGNRVALALQFIVAAEAAVQGGDGGLHGLLS